MTAVAFAKSRRPLSLIVLALLLTLLLTACSAETEIGDNRALSEDFMDHILSDRYDEAYALVQGTVTAQDFNTYWNAMRTVTEGATSYEMEQIGWQMNTSDGLTTLTTAYRVTTDTERIFLLNTVTRNDIEGIAGLYFSDVTDFVHSTDAYIPVVNGILIGVSILIMAFTVWMMIDCLRRKMKRKPLWIILILAGISLTLTMGQTSSFNFGLGLFFNLSSAVADPALQSIVVKLMIPVGAILYFCLRKKLTVDPNASEGAVDAAQLVLDDMPVGTAAADESAEYTEPAETAAANAPADPADSDPTA